VDPQLQAQLFADVPPITLLNPISSQLAVMRCSLWPGLIQAARENLRRQQERCGCLKWPRGLRVGLRVRWWKVSRSRAWLWHALAGAVGSSREAADFYDVKGDIEALLALHGGPDVHRFEAAADVACLHPDVPRVSCATASPLACLANCIRH